jgi:hypothetical protein
MENDELEKLGEELKQRATESLLRSDKDWSTTPGSAREIMTAKLRRLALEAADNEGTLAVSGMLFMILVSMEVGKDIELMIAMTNHVNGRVEMLQQPRKHNDTPIGY